MLPRPFLLWLLAVYGGWLALMTLGEHWSTAVSHWPIALTMALGSYVAGSTPMGGGTVAFPVLVLLFDMPGSLGRDFALAIQSVGMTSATVYILSSRQPLAWNLLRPALLGALLGTPLGLAFVAPVVPDLWIKLVFAVVWASFGLLHLLKLRQLVAFEGRGRRFERDRGLGIGVGLLGGLVASITGVGIDMVLYAVLVLLYRTDLKQAIPTSVVLMAFTSLVGILTRNLLASLAPGTYAIDPEVFANWLAAAPVVALGAPLGALVVRLIPRAPTLVVVSLLCLGQFVWTLLHEGVTGWPLAAAFLGFLALVGAFELLYRVGGRVASRDLDPVTERMSSALDSLERARADDAAWVAASSREALERVEWDDADPNGNGEPPG